MGCLLLKMLGPSWLVGLGFPWGCWDRNRQAWHCLLGPEHLCDCPCHLHGREVSNNFIAQTWPPSQSQASRPRLLHRTTRFSSTSSVSAFIQSWRNLPWAEEGRLQAGVHAVSTHLTDIWNPYILGDLRAEIDLLLHEHHVPAAAPVLASLPCSSAPPH